MEVQVGFRLPAPVLKAIDRVAEEEMASRSTVLRQMVVASLRERGLWPPKKDEGGEA